MFSISGLSNTWSRAKDFFTLNRVGITATACLGTYYGISLMNTCLYPNVACPPQPFLLSIFSRCNPTEVCQEQMIQYGTSLVASAATLGVGAIVRRLFSKNCASRKSRSIEPRSIDLPDESQNTKLQTSWNAIPESSEKMLMTTTCSDFIWLTTNEINPWETIQKLKKSNVQGNAVVGVSLMYLLSLAAAFDSCEYIFALDKSEKVINIWKAFLTILKNSATRKHFVFKLKRFCKELLEQQFKKWEPELQNVDSWIGTDETFKKIKRIVEQGRFFYKKLNLLDTEIIYSIADFMDTHNISPLLIYDSNVKDYLDFFKDGPEKFERNMEILENLNKYFIPLRLSCKTEDLIQNLRGGIARNPPKSIEQYTTQEEKKT